MALFPSSSSTAFEDISRKIYLLRLPLIFLIVFIHARFMDIDYPDRWSRLLSENVLIGKMPHCAVIFFFVISGYLFTWTEQSGYLNLIQRKGYTLLIPYILWNTMLMAVHLLCGLLPYKKLLPAFKYAGMTPWQVVVRSYGLDMGMPIDVPLWYVRDLLLLFLVAPLLIWLVRRLPLWFTPLLLLAATFFMEDCSVLFFSFGLFCRYWDIDLRPLSKWWPLFIGAPLGYFITAEFTGINWPLMLWISVPFYTGIAMLLQRLPQHLQKHMIHFGEYSFWIYCSHAPVATTVTRIGISLNYLGMPPAVWIALNSVVTVAIIVSCLWVLRRIMPSFVALLCGSRFPLRSRKKSSVDDEGKHDPNGTQAA
jgi:succinoglycan biosynthesis protein ExoH